MSDAEREAALFEAYRIMRAIWRDHGTANRMAHVAVAVWAGERQG